MRLSGQHVMVTGASRGIGRALAEELADRGATVSAVSRSDPDFTSTSPLTKLRHYGVDLTRREDLRGLVALTESDNGPLDVLINNAGVPLLGAAWEQSEDDLADSIALNTLAPLELTRQALPGMIGRGRGCIVMVSSLSGIGAFPTLATYGATKAAIAQYLAALDMELAGTGVSTTLVELGEVTGTDASANGRQQSPVIARSVNRLDRLRLMPTLHVPTVVTAIIDSIQRDRTHLVLPRRCAPLSWLRNTPTALNRALLTGIDPVTGRQQ